MNNQKRQNLFDICKNCEEPGLIVNHSEGSIVCPSCGVVQGIRIIDESSEWRNFAKDNTSLGGDDQKRVGDMNNDLLPGRGLCTVISSVGGKDSSLTRWSQRSMQSTAEKTLIRGFRSIDELCNSLNLADVIKEEAKKIFKTLDEQKALKGKSHNAVIGACVFIACRKRNNPRSIREISNEVLAEKKDILKCYSIVKKSLPQVNGNKSAAEYAKRYAAQLGYSEQASKISQLVAEKAIEKGLVTGKSPLSVASAAVFLVAKLSGSSRTYSEITAVSSMKEVTIKNCYKSISVEVEQLVDALPPGWSKDNLTLEKLNN